jgi:hypothetical protein
MRTNHSRYKDDSVLHIIIELLHQGNIDQSLDYLETIKSDQFKFRCLKNISIKIAKMDNWPLAEKLVSNINKVGIRQ